MGSAAPGGIGRLHSKMGAPARLSTILLDGHECLILQSRCRPLWLRNEPIFEKKTLHLPVPRETIERLLSPQADRD
jgi:hypothetical protein